MFILDAKMQQTPCMKPICDLPVEGVRCHDLTNPATVCGWWRIVVCCGVLWCVALVLSLRLAEGLLLGKSHSCKNSRADAL